MSKTDAVVCGRIIGKHDGWDQADTWAIILLDFEPSEEFCQKISCNSVMIHFEKGNVELYQNNELVHTGDLVDMLKNCRAYLGDW